MNTSTSTTKIGDFDLSSLRQCTSPDSSNVYSVIASDGETKEIAVSIEPYPSQQSCMGLNIRFCVLCDEDPCLKVFSLRGSPKQYQIRLVPIKQTGASLDKVSFKVSPNAKPLGSILETIAEDDGWTKLALWVTTALDAEGMKTVMFPAQLSACLATIAKGTVVEPSLAYPLPIGEKEPMKTASQKKVVKDTTDYTAELDGEED